jgi:hypothetical protein
METRTPIRRLAFPGRQKRLPCSFLHLGEMGRSVLRPYGGQPEMAVPLYESVGGFGAG